MIRKGTRIARIAGIARTATAAVVLLVLLAALLMPAVALAANASYSTVIDGLLWGDGINANTVHNTWYAAGRHWVMFVQDVPEIERNIVCSSTDDYGATWDSFTVVGNITTLFRGVAIWYQEATNILHFTYTDMGNDSNNLIYYRAATPNTNGTFTYLDSAYQLEEGTGTEGLVLAIAIACDETNVPFIAWTEDEGGSGYFWVEVASSTTGNGTWTESLSTWEEFDASQITAYGHDYDTLFSGNWTAVAVNLCPVDNGGDLMQLSWSVEDRGADDAGIDSTIWNDDDGFWGNCSWIVPVDDTNGLYPNTIGEIAFSCYDLGAALHFVYTNAGGQVMYNAKSQIEDWDEINGPGNWTMIKDVGYYAMPAIAGYEQAVMGEDLIVVVNTLGGLYYDTCPYSGSFTGVWTEIWGVPGGPDGEFVFLHSLQYKYTGGSPVGFAWDWGNVTWDEGAQTGELDYWFIDQDGEDAGENPLGWYYYYEEPGVAGDSLIVNLLQGLLPLILALTLIYATFKSTDDWETRIKMVMVSIAGMVMVYLILAIL